jgi:glycosyltransferase involved in cell wall biosynthesis
MPVKRLSVVIPTYNRRDRLARVLAALERQTTPAADFEVVIVDDGSTDGTTEWLGQRATPFELCALRQANAGPARARNAGVERASGEIVLFIDDDVEPVPELIAEHLRLHAAEPNIVVIGPLASLPHYEQPWVAWEQAKVEAQYRAMERGDWAPTFRQFWTGNASLARAHILGAGGFDPSYLRAEDVELGVRLKDRGLSFRFNPAARGLHFAERSLASWERVHESYGKAEVEIFGKLGPDELLEMLAGNWRRLNPATRWLVRSCLGKPARHSAARMLLRSHLQLALRLKLPMMSEQVCSVFANLLYWEASTQALGPTRSAAVLGGHERGERGERGEPERSARK